MTETVLILGGYGVFGGRLAKRLAQDQSLQVIVAGRNLDQAQAFASALGCAAACLDTQAEDFECALGKLTPNVIVDAAGPYQSYLQRPYRVAEAAIDLGAHYLDLSDDAAFTQGIATLDEAAKAAGVTVLSGVSSVPAISSTVAAHLGKDLEEVQSIETVILPGNRAPRGISVMRAVLSQVGQPLRLWRAGRWIERPAWSDLRRYDLYVPGARPVNGRRASLIGAPDLHLFPDQFAAQSVTFRAGLELSIMQYSLWVLHWLPRLKWIKSLLPLTGLLKWLADQLERFGSDRGGMQVRLCGRTVSGDFVDKSWTMIVEQGDGPYVPGVPAAILISKLQSGSSAAGAEPCLNRFSMPELESGFSGLSIVSGETQRPVEPLFQSILGAEFETLPPPLKNLHRIAAARLWKGRAKIERGSGWVARLMGAIAGFPPAAEEIDVSVEMICTPKGETWIRTFGAHQFRSFLSPGKRSGRRVLRERFGLLTFGIAIHQRDESLHFPVRGVRCFGIPLPSFFLPKSETREFVDAGGRPCFDVRISTPFGGLIAHYRGWLEDAAAT